MNNFNPAKSQLLSIAAAVTLICLCPIYLGFCFAARGLVTSDTCWLLALGRIVWETHQIPHSDPLSFTLPLAAACGMPLPFVPHQWLFELLLYAVYLLGKLSALISFCSAAMAFAFVAVPLIICARVNAPKCVSCGMVVLLALSAAMRTSVRPEVCTYAFMAIWLGLLQSMRLSAAGRRVARAGADTRTDIDASAFARTDCNGTVFADSKTHTTDSNAQSDSDLASGTDTACGANASDSTKASDSTNTSNSTNTDSHSATAVSSIDWRMVVSCSLLQLVWCNCHSGFVLGLAVLVVYALSFIIQDLITNAVGEKRIVVSSASKTALLALVMSATVTLLNPVGIRLWTFMPTLLFSQIGQGITEMRHVEVSDLARIVIYPYFALLILALISVVYNFRSGKQRILSWKSPLRLASILLIICAAFESLNCMRLIPVMALLIVCETASVLGRGFAPLFSEMPGLMLFPLEIERQLSSSAKKTLFIAWLILPSISAALSSLIFADRFTPLSLPQPSELFSPPKKAFDFLMNHKPKGPLFNEAKIGSMIAWYLPNTKVFLDTRFDQYGTLLLADYNQILYARENCRQLLDTYGIDWVFVTKSAPIASILAHSGGWETSYSDDDAIIFARSKGTE